ncbi:hypothetical protein ACFWZU_10280 [Frateuria sp. GZRR33]|uniref:hypothetical protein n=1 Tax=Frateuria sp. GZRR33 TaxID=3351535 RepID=UPI003EDBEED1
MSSALRRFVTDHHGRVVVAEPPNGPILAWTMLAVAARASAGPAKPLLRAAGDAALAWWAGSELLDGDSPFRRTLGGATLLLLANKRLRRATP